MFCREMDSDNISDPCFSLVGLVLLSADQLQLMDDGDFYGDVAVPLWRPLWSLVSVCGEMLQSGGKWTYSLNADCLPTYDLCCPQKRLDACSREVGVGHAADFADGCGRHLWNRKIQSRTGGTITIRQIRSFLTQFTANPATPTKTSHRKGSAKTLF